MYVKLRKSKTSARILYLLVFVKVEVFFLGFVANFYGMFLMDGFPANLSFADCKSQIFLGAIFIIFEKARMGVEKGVAEFRLVAKVGEKRLGYRSDHSDHIKTCLKMILKGVGGGMGHSLVWPRQVCAAEQGMANSCAKRNEPAS